MSNGMCDHWLTELGSTEYDVFLVESLKFKQYQFAQVLVTGESTYSSPFAHKVDSTCTQNSHSHSHARKSSQVLILASALEREHKLVLNLYRMYMLYKLK